MPLNVREFGLVSPCYPVPDPSQALVKVLGHSQVVYEP